MRAQRSNCTLITLRAWLIASALVLAAGISLPGSFLFGHDDPKAKQAVTSEKASKTPSAELDKPRAEPAKALLSAGVPQDWLKSLTWRSIGPSNMGGRTIAISVFEKDPS